MDNYFGINIIILTRKLSKKRWKWVENLKLSTIIIIIIIVIVIIIMEKKKTSKDYV